ncbi:MAG: DNA internalization-related competence protein ComEC/Rec2 [Nitrosomonadales bacterium]|nr:DNA internalization-related competence protein ComEC/Rec2 [Nitrosomonadales bacterium]
MVAASLFFALGVWLLQQQAALPDLRWAGLTAPLFLALLLPRRALWQRVIRRALLAALACALGFFYAAWVAQQRLAESLPAGWQGKDIEVVGVVAEMPRRHERGLSFTFDVGRAITPGASVPRRLLLSTYTGEEDESLALHAGERWNLTVRLKQPHGASNPYGFDFEAWALERNLRAAGYVHGKGDNRRLDEQVAAPRYFIERMRESVRGNFQRTLGDAPYAGVLTALAIGDQGSIPTAQWQVFTRTGVNHLMSISGLHITMLAGLAFSLIYALWRRSARLVLHLPARKAAAVAGLLVALAYALLSGFSEPAQRTVYMLAAIAAALWLSRAVAASQILAAALLVVALSDPWAVLSPGFWLSFGAVALIFYVTAHRLGRPHWLQEGDGKVVGQTLASPLRGLAEYGRVQWAMMIGLIPPLLALFQQVSLVSPVANTFAIPLVSFIVVPLALLGALLPLEWVLHLAHQTMSACMAALEWLNRLPDAVWAQHAPPAWSIALGVAGALWCLLPRGFPARWLGLIAMLPMFLVPPVSPPHGALRLVIFDVGQGMAVAAQTHGHTLLYDTGPDFSGDADSGSRILVPSLRAQGISRLDGLMLTHDDSDHTGGALSVMQAMPVGWLSSSLPDDSPILQQARNLQRCADGQSWEWDGVRFEVLHPPRESYSQAKVSKNNRGCVLRISAGAYSVLLASDIEKPAELLLLKQHGGKLPATLLLVPHHGSKTSSVQPFVEAVRPRYAVFAAGYRNRFGHPRDEVVERYRAIGSELLRSDEDGAIIVNMDARNFRVERYRKSHVRYWQHSGSAEP